MTQLMTPTIALSESDRTAADDNTRFTLTIVLATLAIVAVAIGLGATGNPIAFAVAAGLLVTVFWAGASWAASKFLG